MSLVPSAMISKRWYDTLRKIQYGRLTFIDPSGASFVATGPYPGPVATFHINEWDVLSRTVARGDIGLGEDYIAGAWETKDIQALISLFLLNLDHFEGFAHGGLWNRVMFTLMNTLIRRNSMGGSRRNIEAHYDVGNDFYELWLDETMTYSSALYQSSAVSLQGAQRAKYARILDKIKQPRANILEIGCGWGGFAEEAVARNHNLTGLTISPAQHQFANNRLGAKADIRLEDYRKIKGTYDTIVSIEMLEAVGEQYWPRYFSIVAERLKRGGNAIIQFISVRDEIFPGYRKRSDFIRHYVFPGGMLPSLQRVKEEANRAGLHCLETFSFGQHYAQTLNAWAERQSAAETHIRALGHDDRFVRNWKFYLGMCAAAFAVERTSVHQIELTHA